MPYDFLTRNAACAARAFFVGETEYFEYTGRNGAITRHVRQLPSIGKAAGVRTRRPTEEGFSDCYYFATFTSTPIINRSASRLVSVTFDFRLKRVLYALDARLMYSKITMLHSRKYNLILGGVLMCIDHRRILLQSKGKYIPTSKERTLVARSALYFL